MKNESLIISDNDVPYKSFYVEVVHDQVVSLKKETIGGKLNILGYDTINLWLDYEKGDEDYIELFPKMFLYPDGKGFELYRWEESDQPPVRIPFLASFTGVFDFPISIGGIGYIECAIQAFKKDGKLGNPGKFTLSYSAYTILTEKEYSDIDDDRKRFNFECQCNYINNHG